MDAILAVAIGGNSLGGWQVQHHRFHHRRVHDRDAESEHLLRLEVNGTETIKAFKAVFIIILMIVSSPVVREYLCEDKKSGTNRFFRRRSAKGRCSKKFSGFRTGYRLQKRRRKVKSLKTPQPKEALSNSNLLFIIAAAIFALMYGFAILRYPEKLSAVSDLL